MKKSGLAVTVSLLLVGFCLSATASANEIKSRMMKRLPIIKALKVKGVIGENNKGYLVFRGPKENEDEVTAENADRKTIYDAIAKQQGVSSAVVGMRRAAMIEQKAAPGEWLQDANGKWYQK